MEQPFSGNYWSNTPNTVSGAGFAWLAAVPGMTALAIVVHDLSLNPVGVWAALDAQVNLLTGAGLVALVAGLARSAWKGLTTPASPRPSGETR